MALAFAELVLMLAGGEVAAESRPSARAYAAGEVAPARANADAGADTEAEAHLRRGRALILEGRHDDAYRELEQGHRLSARPQILFEMGECARAGGAVERARQAYARYLVEDPDGHLVPMARLRLGELAGALPPGPNAPTPPATSVPPPVVGPTSPPAGVSPARVPQTPTPEARSGSPSLSSSRDGGTEPPPRSRRWPLWVAAGAALVLAIGAGVIYATSREGESCGKGCFDLRQ
jgi:tetratricopeptide (TPR) repeat protein